MARFEVVFNMRNQHKGTPQHICLNSISLLQLLNSRFISLPFTPLTPLTPRQKQWKINIKRPFLTSW